MLKKVFSESEKAGLEEEEQWLGAGFGPGEAAGTRGVDQRGDQLRTKVPNIGRFL